MLAIGPYWLSPERHEVCREDGTRIPLTPRSFDLLVYLATHPGRGPRVIETVHRCGYKPIAPGRIPYGRALPGPDAGR